MTSKYENKMICSFNLCFINLNDIYFVLFKNRTSVKKTENFIDS